MSRWQDFPVEGRDHKEKSPDSDSTVVADRATCRKAGLRGLHQVCEGGVRTREIAFVRQPRAQNDCKLCTTNPSSDKKRRGRVPDTECTSRSSRPPQFRRLAARASKPGQSIKRIFRRSLSGRQTLPGNRARLAKTMRNQASIRADRRFSGEYASRTDFKRGDIVSGYHENGILSLVTGASEAYHNQFGLAFMSTVEN